MKRVLHWGAVVITIGAVMFAGYWLLLDGHAPAKRPDLVRLPSGHLSVRWWPVEAQAHQALEWRTGEGPPVVLEAQRKGELFAVTVPRRCDGGITGAYIVKGMEAPVPVVFPPCPSEQRARFVFLADTQADEEAIALAARRVAEFGPQFVLHGGDLVDLGSKERHWIEYFHAVSRFGRSVATVPTLGNHERYLDDAFPLYRRFFLDDQPTWTLFSAGPVDVLVLDSEQIEDEALNTAQLRWLEQTLGSLRDRPEARRRWRVVLTHHAPFSSTLASSTLLPFERSTLLQEHYVPLFEHHQVDLVLAGHSHVYERLEVNGISYVVAGTVGGFLGLPSELLPASIVRKNVRTYSTLEVDAAGLLMETWDLEGKPVDALRLAKAPER